MTGYGYKIDNVRTSNEAPKGVCAPLIPENNALISPNPWKKILSYMKVFSFAPKILKINPRKYKPILSMRGSRNVRQGGGVQVILTKMLWQRFFVCFFSPQLILQKSNGQFQRNQSIFKVPEGIQHFAGGGGPTFSREGPIAHFL